MIARSRAFQILLLLPLLLGCGKDSLVAPDADLAFLVGDWDATRFVVQSMRDPQTAPDLIRALGATFSLNVQPSGQYTAILVYQGNPVTEIGLLEVVGEDVVFHVSFPSKDTTRSRLTRSSMGITLVGDTEFAFVPGGAPQPAIATIDLIKR